MKKAYLFRRVRRVTAGSPGASLGKIRRIVEEAQGQAQGAKFKSFAIVSPNRGSWGDTLKLPGEMVNPEWDAEANQATLQGIKMDLKTMKCQQLDGRTTPCGYRLCEGIGQEESGPQKEPSFFVPNLTLAQAEDLWRDYYQWGIVYCGPETKGKVMLMFHDDGNPIQVNLGGMWTFTNPENQQMLEREQADPTTGDAFKNKTRFRDKDFLFASVHPILRPRA